MGSALRPTRPGTVMGRGRVDASRVLRGCAALLALAATGCLDDSATAPQTTPARLSVNASVAGAAAAQVTSLGVRIDYMRSTGGTASLSSQDVALGDMAPGSTISQPLTVELGPCLSDPQHLPEGGSCRVMIQVTLLAGTQVLDVTTIGPVDLRPGQTAEPQAITLHAVSGMSITPRTPAPMYVGDELQLNAATTDASGQPVSGREVEWASSAASVASVESSGKVTAVAPGTATITASAGGREASVSVTVLARPVVAVSLDKLSFSARRTAMLPDPSSVQIANGGAGTLTGLKVGTISYEGGATGWLSASLRGTTAPTTISIRPSTTELEPGSYTAVVPISAPGASAGASIRVSYEVLPGATLSLDRSRVTMNHESPETVKVTTSAPVSRLDMNVQYSSSESGWLDATLKGDVVTLELNEGSFSLTPGRHVAWVSVSAPEAPRSVEIEVEYTSMGSGFYLELDYFCSEKPGTLVLLPEMYGYASDTLAYYNGFGTTLTIQDEGLLFTNGGTQAHAATGDSVMVTIDPEYSGQGIVTVAATLDAAPSTVTDTAYMYLFELCYSYIEAVETDYLPGYPKGSQHGSVQPTISLLRSRDMTSPSGGQDIVPLRASRVAGEDF